MGTWITLLVLKYCFKGRFSTKRWYFITEISVKPQRQRLPVMAWRRNKMNISEALAVANILQASPENCRAFQMSVEMHPRWFGFYIAMSLVQAYLMCFFLPFLKSRFCVLLTLQTGSLSPCFKERCESVVLCSLWLGHLWQPFVDRDFYFLFSERLSDLAVSHVTTLSRWEKLSATAGTSTKRKKWKQTGFDLSC